MNGAAESTIGEELRGRGLSAEDLAKLLLSGTAQPNRAVDALTRLSSRIARATNIQVSPAGRCSSQPKYQRCAFAVPQTPLGACTTSSSSSCNNSSTRPCSNLNRPLRMSCSRGSTTSSGGSSMCGQSIMADGQSVGQCAQRELSQRQIPQKVQALPALKAPPSQGSWLQATGGNATIQVHKPLQQDLPAQQGLLVHQPAAPAGPSFVEPHDDGAGGSSDSEAREGDVKNVDLEAVLAGVAVGLEIDFEDDLEPLACLFEGPGSCSSSSPVAAACGLSDDGATLRTPLQQQQQLEEEKKHHAEAELELDYYQVPSPIQLTEQPPSPLLQHSPLSDLWDLPSPLQLSRDGQDSEVSGSESRSRGTEAECGTAGESFISIEDYLMSDEDPPEAWTTSRIPENGQNLYPSSLPPDAHVAAATTTTNPPSFFPTLSPPRSSYARQAVAAAAILRKGGPGGSTGTPGAVATFCPKKRLRHESGADSFSPAKLDGSSIRGMAAPRAPASARGSSEPLLPGSAAHPHPQIQHPLQPAQGKTAGQAGGGLCSQAGPAASAHVPCVMPPAKRQAALFRTCPPERPEIATAACAPPQKDHSGVGSIGGASSQGYTPVVAAAGAAQVEASGAPFTTPARSQQQHISHCSKTGLVSEAAVHATSVAETGCAGGRALGAPSARVSPSQLRLQLPAVMQASGPMTAGGGGGSAQTTEHEDGISRAKVVETVPGKIEQQQQEEERKHQLRPLHHSNSITGQAGSASTFVEASTPHSAATCSNASGHVLDVEPCSHEKVMASVKATPPGAVVEKASANTTSNSLEAEPEAEATAAGGGGTTEIACSASIIASAPPQPTQEAQQAFQEYKARVVQKQQRGMAMDQQSVAARKRRERISIRVRRLQLLVPGADNLDTATVLDRSLNYVTFLEEQVRQLAGSEADAVFSRFAVGCSKDRRGSSSDEGTDTAV